MNEFLLYVALPALVAIAGVSAFYAIKEGNKTARRVEDVLPQQPAPIRDAEFYMKNGHWIFGVKSEPVLSLNKRGYQCHADHQIDCGV